MFPLIFRIYPLIWYNCQARPNRVSTKDRILAKSLELFNEGGARAVGTTHIGEALGMSPGNLYYHYRNREEIVSALFDRLEPEFRATLTADLDPPLSPKRFAAFYTQSFDVLWRYRFFFGALVDLLRRDPELAERYTAFQTWALKSLEAIAGQLVSDGSMKEPPPPDGLKAVATNTWLIWMNWIQFTQTTKADGSITRGDLAQGAFQTFDILKPYLAPKFRQAAIDILAEAAGEQTPLP